MGKHFTVNQMVAKESVQGPAGAPRAGDLLHRVQLHAAPGLRLPPPVRRARLPAAARGQRPVGQHHHGHRADPQGAPGRGLRPDHAARAQGRRHEVRQDRVRDGVARRRAGPARTSCTSSSCAPRTAWWAPTCATSPSSTTTPSGALDDETAEHPERREAQRALAREVCTLVHGEPRRRGPRPPPGAVLGRARRRSTSTSLLEVCAETPTSTRGARRARRSGLTLVDALVDAGLAPSKSRARTTRHPGRGVRERPAGDRHRRAARCRRTCSSTATSSCARGGTTISCASSDAPGEPTPQGSAAGHSAGAPRGGAHEPEEPT